MLPPPPTGQVAPDLSGASLKLQPQSSNAAPLGSQQNPIQMTRAEYQAKYGAAPAILASAPLGSQANPIPMTHAEYMAKYGTPTTQQPSAPTDFMTHLGNIASSITDFLGLHGTVDTLGTNAANIGNALNPNTSLDQKVAMSKALPQTSLEQNVGAGLQLSSLISGGAAAPAADTAVGIGRGIIAGAKAGAKIGSGLGALQGAGGAMTDNQDALGVAENTAIGAGVGGVGGGIAGGVIGGIGGGIKANVLAKTPEGKLNTALDITSPSLNKKATISSMEKAGTLGGPNEPTLTGTSKQYTPHDIKIAQSVKDVVSPNKSPEGNIININRKIASESDNIATELKNNPVPFNFQDFRDFMTQHVLPDATLKNAPGSHGTYSRVRENLITTVYNDLKAKAKETGDFGSITDMGQLWDARKGVDTRIENELGSTVFDSPQYTGVKAAATDFRNAFNQFIGENYAHPGQMEQVNVMHDIIQGARARGIDIPNTAEAMDVLRKQLGINVSHDVASARAATFRDAVSELSNMYQARRNIAESSYRLLDKNIATRFIAQHPVGVKIGKALLAGLGIGVAGDIGLKAIP